MFFLHLAEVFSRLRGIGLGEHILKESQCQKKGLEPHYLGVSQNNDARKCLFLAKKNRFQASLFWDIPICETSIQRVVFYLNNFRLCVCFVSSVPTSAMNMFNYYEFSLGMLAKTTVGPGHVCQGLNEEVPVV